MKKHLLDFELISNQSLNHNHNLLGLRCTSALPAITPGQFVEVRVDGSPSTYLRRPFSVHRVDYNSNTMHLLIKSIGEGTSRLASLLPGQLVNIILPLGQGFPLDENKNVLLVGGGCGVAPLWFLASELKKRNNNITMLIGGRTNRDVLMPDAYTQFGNVLVSTEDGSLGERGMVTGHSFFKDQVSGINTVYCCGPDGMMKAVSHIAEKFRIPCYVSLENTMACGMGACLCCIVDTKQGHRCVCTDGPVFNSLELKGWSAEIEVGCSIDQ